MQALQPLFHALLLRFGKKIEDMKKLHKIPAQMAEPMTPDELHAIPCISKKFVGSSFKPVK